MFLASTPEMNSLASSLGCFEVDYSPFLFLSPSLLPAMNEDSVCDAFKPAAQFTVPRVINPAVLITFVVWLCGCSTKLRCVSVWPKRIRPGSFAFHLSYKFKITEPEGCKRSRKQWSIIRTQFLLLWRRVPWSARAAGKTSWEGGRGRGDQRRRAGERKKEGGRPYRSICDEAHLHNGT